jgi:ribosome assembly protein RRB1
MSDSEGDDDEPAQLHIRKVAHAGGVNRVRACPQQQHVVATWADTAQVQVWDLSQQLAEIRDEAASSSSKDQGRLLKVSPRHAHSHSAEGFALDWSPVAAGRLASGDCRSRIHVWEPTTAGGRGWGPGPALGWRLGLWPGWRPCGVCAGEA